MYGWDWIGTVCKERSMKRSVLSVLMVRAVLGVIVFGVLVLSGVACAWWKTVCWPPQ